MEALTSHSTRGERAYTEYANCSVANVVARKWKGAGKPSYLLTILFTPGEDTSLTISCTQDQFDIFLVHAPCPPEGVSIVEVDSMLMQQLPSLLFVICPEGVNQSLIIHM